MKHLTILPYRGFAVLALGLVLLAGCGSDQPAATVAPDPLSTDEQTATALGNSRSQNSQGSESARVPSQGSWTSSGGAGSAYAPSASKLIDGAMGGIISTGRFTLTIPAGAFPGNRIITITDARVSRPQCTLSPAGLQFNVPVLLEMDVRGTSCDSPHVTIYRFSPTANMWFDMNGTFSRFSHTVRTSITSLAGYRAAPRD